MDMYELHVQATETYFVTIFSYNIWRTDEIVELTQKYRKGGRYAFEFLYLRYKDLVFRNALFMIGNRQEAEDVLQDAFIIAWNSRNKYDSKKAKFVTWLHKGTVNWCIDNFCKKQLLGYVMTGNWLIYQAWIIEIY